MSSHPWTIGSDATLVQARELMREHRIRHLPVLENAKLAGLISERDVRRLDELVREDPDTRVKDAMSVDVFVAGVEDPLDEVLERMASNRYGSAVVLGRDGAIAGILTTVDAMQFLAELLKRETASG